MQVRFLSRRAVLIFPRSRGCSAERFSENILLGIKENSDVLMEAIRLSVFEQDLAQMPNGLETVIGPKGIKLSGGQMQRAAAARMFVRQPDLLVMDDLSSALDVETEEQLWNRLGECATPPVWWCHIAARLIVRQTRSLF